MFYGGFLRHRGILESHIYSLAHSISGLVLFTGLEKGKDEG